MFKNMIIPNGEEAKFVFFSGKGGVGKTTVSASTAVWLANQGYNTLVVSTDLQKSLNDIFEQDIKPDPTPITGISNLKAVSIDTGESIERHRKKIMETLEMVDSNSLLLKQIKDDKKTDCGCAQAAVFEFGEYLNKDKEYDVIVFDTAPVGSTLEKIGAQTKYVLGILNQLEVKKKLIEELGESGLKEQIKSLEEIKQEDERAIENLRSDRTSFVMVMIPEGMPLVELERNIPVLENNYNIPIRGIVINNILPERERSSTDFWRTKWAMQNRYINLTYQKFKDKKIGKVQLLDTEVLGLKKLKIIGEHLYGGD